MGSFIPNSSPCPTKVVSAKRFGVNKGSTPSFDRRNKGVDADNKVGSAACKNATGAIENGRVQEDKDRKVESMDRGG